MSRKLLYIINPISGTSKKENLQAILERETRLAKISYEITASDKDGNYTAFVKKIEENRFTDIIICGGDGTVSQVLSSLYHLPVNFGIIPMGSGNGLARAAKIPMNTQKALQVIFNGFASKTDAFTVNGKFACMLVGLGFDAAVAHSFAKSKTRGLSTYIKETIKNLFNRKFYETSIFIGEKQIDTSVFLLNIANGNQYGNEFKIAPFANLQDGLLDVVVIKKQCFGKLLKNIFQLIVGFKKPATAFNEKKSLLYFQAPQIRIENKNGAPFHIDGDPAGSPASLEIKIISNAYSLLRTK